MVLNYQSNALKFINKKTGKVYILLQYIPALERMYERKMIAVDGDQNAATYFSDFTKKFFDFDFVEEATQ